jgi:hypothetical protein
VRLALACRTDLDTIVRQNSTFVSLFLRVVIRRPVSPLGYGWMIREAHWGGNWGYPRVHEIGNSGKDGQIYNCESVTSRSSKRRVV